MKYTELEQLTSAWETMTSTVLGLKKLSLPEMQVLLSETYQALRKYYQDKLVPKEISKVLLGMDDFLYFASLMEEKEVGIDFYNYQYISSIVVALKKGFFEADYGCDFPELKTIDKNNNECSINFETDIFSK